MGRAKGWMGGGLALVLWALPQQAASERLTLQPKLTVAERYNDNVSNAVSDRSDDWISSVAPSLRMVYQPQFFRAEAGYELEQLWYLRRDELNRLNHLGDVNVSHDGIHWSQNINAGVLSSTLGDRTAEANEGISVPRTEFLKIQAGGGLQYRPSERTTTSLRYAYTDNRYQSDLLNDSRTHTGGLSWGYQMTRRHRLTLSGGGSHLRFASARTIWTADGSIQWSYEASRLTTITVGSGVGVVSGPTARWLADLQVDHRLEDGSITLQYRRDFGTGGGLSQSAVLNEQVRLSASSGLGKETTAHVTGGIGRTDSAGKDEVSAAVAETEARYWNASAGLSHRLFRWLSVSFNYQYHYQKTHGLIEGTLRSHQGSIVLSTQWQPWVLKP